MSLAIQKIQTLISFEIAILRVHRPRWTTDPRYRKNYVKLCDNRYASVPQDCLGYTVD